MMRLIARDTVLPALAVAAVCVGWNATGSVSAAQSARGRSLPVFEVDQTWPNVPPRWKVTEPSSLAIDAQDNVWVLQRPRALVTPEDAAMAAPPVMVFDGAGTFIKAWGGPGAGFEWPQREHAIRIDHAGSVWITGNNCPTYGFAGLEPLADDQILKFTQDGRFLLQIGRSNQSTGNADTRNVHRAGDVWVHQPTSELFVADGYGNHRVVVFDAITGAYKRMWGAFGNAPVDDDQCGAVEPASFPPGPGPPDFSIVHALRVSTDGIVYVADRQYRRVQAFTLDGRFLTQVVKTDTLFARNVALSPDAAQQFLYVGNGQDIVIVDRASMEIVGSIKAPGMIGGGHHIATDSKGNLYIAQSPRMQKLVFKGMSRP